MLPAHLAEESNTHTVTDSQKPDVPFVPFVLGALHGLLDIDNSQTREFLKTIESRVHRTEVIKCSKKNNIYIPPYPSRRKKFAKKKKKIRWVEERVDPDSDVSSITSGTFSPWTAKDEKIFWEKSVPDIRETLKHKDENLARKYQMEDNPIKKVFVKRKVVMSETPESSGSMEDNLTSDSAETTDEFASSSSAQVAPSSAFNSDSDDEGALPDGDQQQGLS